MRICILLLFLFAIPLVNGQDERNPMLADEFGPIQCDDMLARIDNLSNELNADPKVTGLVVLEGAHRDVLRKLNLEMRFTSAALQRRLDSSRVKVLRGSEEGEPRMRFYVVSSNVDVKMSSSTWDLTIPTNTKPLLFAWDDDGICIYPTVYKYLKELLDANAGLKVNVVLPEIKAKDFQKHAAMVRDALGNPSGRRLKFYKDRSDNAGTSTFWLVP